ncbi:hypothetical protein ACU635_15385 [[Actinomadura] parvosata]
MPTTIECAAATGVRRTHPFGRIGVPDRTVYDIGRLADLLS